MWLCSTEDWSIGESGGATRDQVNANLQKWITGPKSPGLIILEHELTNQTVGAFMQAFPLIAQNGWKFESLARLNNSAVYQNSLDHDGTVVPATVAVSASEPVSSTSASAASSSAKSSGSAGNNAASTASAKGSQATGSGDASRNGAVAQLASPVLAGLVTLFGLAGAVFVL